MNKTIFGCIEQVYPQRERGCITSFEDYERPPGSRYISPLEGHRANTASIIATDLNNYHKKQEIWKASMSIAQLKIYMDSLQTSTEGPGYPKKLEGDAKIMLNGWKDFVYNYLVGIYEVYINNLKGDELGSKEELKNIVHISLLRYVDTIKFEATRTGLLDVNINNVQCRIDPVRDVPLSFPNKHSIYNKVREEEAKIKIPMGLVGVEEEDATSSISALKTFHETDKSELNAEFYKNFNARTSRTIGERGKLTLGEYLARTGDVFAPILIRIPVEMYAYEADMSLWEYMTDRGYLTIYKVIS